MSAPTTTPADGRAANADQTAWEYARERYRRQGMHVGTATDRERSAFVEGAAWATERITQAIEAVWDDSPRRSIGVRDGLAHAARIAREVGEADRG